MIVIKDLNFYYSVMNPIFTGLTTEFEQGKIYGLLGKNGAGKTTLLKLIVGSRFWISGSITVGGYESWKRLPQMYEQIVILPEQFQLPMVRAEDYVKYFGAFYPKFDYGQLQQMLLEFEIPSRRYLTEMSYGQRKKFLISFVLATGARYVLMDEPTNGLDIPSKMKFRSIVAESLTPDRLFIISTHQVKDVEGLIDHVKIIDKGKILLEADLEYLAERVKIVFSDEPLPEALYAVSTFGKWICLVPNKDGVPSQLDLEMIFTAAIAKDQKFKKYLENIGAVV